MVPYEPEVTYWWPTKSVILLHTAIGRRIKVHRSLANTVENQNSSVNE